MGLGGQRIEGKGNRQKKGIILSIKPLFCNTVIICRTKDLFDDVINTIVMKNWWDVDTSVCRMHNDEQKHSF